MTPSRRQFLTAARIAPPAPDFRLPWMTHDRLADRCNGCGDCARACPQGIVGMADGYPRIRLNGGECTFCGDCVTACARDVFDTALARPWPVSVELGPDCLLSAGIACRLCTDACDRAALRFDLRARPVGAVLVDADACTGCGACLPACPNGSLHLTDARLSGTAT